MNTTASHRLPPKPLPPGLVMQSDAALQETFNNYRFPDPSLLPEGFDFDSQSEDHEYSDHTNDDDADESTGVTDQTEEDSDDDEDSDATTRMHRKGRRNKRMLKSKKRLRSNASVLADHEADTESILSSSNVSSSTNASGSSSFHNIFHQTPASMPVADRRHSNTDHLPSSHDISTDLRRSWKPLSPPATPYTFDNMTYRVPLRENDQNHLERSSYIPNMDHHIHDDHPRSLSTSKRKSAIIIPIGPSAGHSDSETELEDNTQTSKTTSYFLRSPSNSRPTSTLYTPSTPLAIKPKPSRRPTNSSHTSSANNSRPSSLSVTQHYLSPQSTPPPPAHPLTNSRTSHQSNLLESLTLKLQTLQTQQTPTAPNSPSIKSASTRSSLILHHAALSPKASPHFPSLIKMGRVRSSSKGSSVFKLEGSWMDVDVVDDKSKEAEFGKKEIVMSKVASSGILKGAKMAQSRKRSSSGKWSSGAVKQETGWMDPDRTEGGFLSQLVQKVEQHVEALQIDNEPLDGFEYTSSSSAASGEEEDGDDFVHHDLPYLPPPPFHTTSHLQPNPLIHKPHLLPSYLLSLPLTHFPPTPPSSSLPQPTSAIQSLHLALQNPQHPFPYLYAAAFEYPSLPLPSSKFSDVSTSTIGMYLLGLCLIEGSFGCKRDIRIGIEVLEKAVERGMQDSRQRGNQEPSQRRQPTTTLRRKDGNEDVEEKVSTVDDAFEILKMVLEEGGEMGTESLLYYPTLALAWLYASESTPVQLRDVQRAGYYKIVSKSLGPSQPTTSAEKKSESLVISTDLAQPEGRKGGSKAPRSVKPDGKEKVGFWGTLKRRILHVSGEGNTMGPTTDAPTMNPIFDEPAASLEEDEALPLPPKPSTAAKAFTVSSPLPPSSRRGSNFFRIHRPSMDAPHAPISHHASPSTPATTRKFSIQGLLPTPQSKNMINGDSVSDLGSSADLLGRASTGSFVSGGKVVGDAGGLKQTKVSVTSYVTVSTMRDGQPLTASGTVSGGARESGGSASSERRQMGSNASTPTFGDTLKKPMLPKIVDTSLCAFFLFFSVVQFQRPACIAVATMAAMTIFASDFMYYQFVDADVAEFDSMLNPLCVRTSIVAALILVLTDFAIIVALKRPQVVTLLTPVGNYVSAAFIGTVSDRTREWQQRKMFLLEKKAKALHLTTQQQKNEVPYFLRTIFAHHSQMKIYPATRTSKENASKEHFFPNRDTSGDKEYSTEEKDFFSNFSAKVISTKRLDYSQVIDLESFWRGPRIKDKTLEGEFTMEQHRGFVGPIRLNLIIITSIDIIFAFVDMSSFCSGFRIANSFPLCNDAQFGYPILAFRLAFIALPALLALIYVWSPFAERSLKKLPYITATSYYTQCLGHM
ncbi:hypothetical protein HDV05_000086 [Chytridiales sp. JEL 0842]|nr:hypothetical protein HDV05_000086 [Chytridiales sp. JEL 0842]